MKRLSVVALLMALFAANMSHAQAPSCPPNTPPASNCEDACIYCNLDGISGVNNGNPVAGGVFCGIEIHNAVYYGFIAGTSSIYFSIPNWNCQTGDGIQAAIYTECNTDAVLACNPGFSGGAGVTLEIGSDGFVPGNIYYLMIDGWIFDQCNFTINVVSGSTQPILPSAPDVPSGPSVVCPGAQAVYSIPQVPGASYYRWTSPVGSSINGQGNNVVVDAADGGHEVTVDFSTGGGQVCVAVGNVCLPQSGLACKPVSNIPQQITVLPTITIPLSQTPYTWDMNNHVYTQPGTYQASNTFVASNGCDSVVRQELIIQAASSGFTSGTVFWDTDEDGVFDAGELPYTTGAVVSTTSGLLTNSNAAGYYEFPNLPQGDTIRVNAPAPGLTVKPPFRVKQSGSTTGYDFGLSPAPVNYDLKINLNSSSFRPGFSAYVFVVCTNDGPSALQDVEAMVELPLDQLDLISLQPAAADVTIVGNQLHWRLDALAAGESATLKIKVGVSAQTMIGTDYILDASVLPISNDYFPPNNFDTRKVTVQGAYDPNDKQANPTVITPALIGNGQAIEYTIRFQNTGTLPADFVRIADVLEGDLDPASFRLIASSHPCTWNISSNGALEFLFDMINLPDSTSDEGGSHGFVRFTVRPRQGLMSGATLENFCDIYFDFNPAIRTNTAITKVAFKTNGSGLHFDDALIVRPNPAAYHAFCEWSTPTPTDGMITLYDLTGQRRLETPVGQGQTLMQLDIQTLATGLYFVVLEAGNLILANKLQVAQPGPLGE